MPLTACRHCRRCVDSAHRTGVAGVHIGVVGEHVAAGARIAGECCVAGIDTGLAHRIATVGVGHRDRAVVGAGDGDGERGARGRAVGIAHRVIEHLGGALPLRQRIGVGIGVVEGVGVAAVAVERERAVGAAHRCADIGADVVDSAHRTGVAGIHIGVVGRARCRWRSRRRRTAVLPGLTPDSLTASPALVSATAIGPSLVPVMVMVSVVLEVAPLASLTV